MNKILILIHDMQIGGAQKSLLAFCQSLAVSPMGENYDVHLMPISPVGAFYSQIPEQIKIVQPPRELRWLGSRFSLTLLKKHCTLRALLGEVAWLIRSKCKLFPRTLNIQQRLWSCWKHFVPVYEENYDVVISYMDGAPNYYAMDKVRAKKKVLWVHSEYQKQGYDPDFDREYFEGCDKIVTISEQCRQCILMTFSFAEEKTCILENITSGEQVIARSQEGTATEFAIEDGWRLLSVGRLNHQKGFDLAVEAARILRDANHRFLWLIVGEGAEREALQEMIDSFDLNEQIKLIGARANPYVYMRECDVLVQPSRVEGKSIVLDETKILCKPIVAANYATVGDSVVHGVTGWIVEGTPETIADGIVEMFHNTALRQQLRKNLSLLPKGNESELKKYIEIMF